MRIPPRTTASPSSAFERARADGRIRHIGFSAHDEKAALAAQERFDFNSVLFPLGFPTWIKGEFGPEYFTPVDFVGLYWHLVDLIWIFLFPLLYLIS